MKSLRIHMITSEDPFYLPVFFKEFLSGLPKQGTTVTGIDITPPLNENKLSTLAKRLHTFYGPVDFCKLAVRYAKATILDKALPMKLWGGTVSRIAARFGIPSNVVPNVNAGDYVAQLKAREVDLLISVAASQIFKADLLGAPRIAAVNVHTGTLPYYRGMMPVFWQMYDGKESIGISVHKMSRELDLGEILLHREVPLDGDRNLDRVIRKMKKQGAGALLEVVEQFRSDSVRYKQLDPTEGKYRSFPGREEAMAFRKMGGRLL